MYHTPGQGALDGHREVRAGDQDEHGGERQAERPLRQHVQQVGELSLPTGQLVAADPFVLWPEDAEAFTETVEPGSYPVSVSLVSWIDGDGVPDAEHDRQIRRGRLGGRPLQPRHDQAREADEGSFRIERFGQHATRLDERAGWKRLVVDDRARPRGRG